MRVFCFAQLQGKDPGHVFLVPALLRYACFHTCSFASSGFRISIFFPVMIIIRRRRYLYLMYWPFVDKNSPIQAAVGFVWVVFYKGSNDEASLGACFS